VQDAEANAEADKAEREKIDQRNKADSLLFATEKTLTEIGDKISADEKAKVQTALDDLKEKLKGDDIEAIKASSENLEKATHKMAEELYKTGQAGAGASAAADAGAGESQPEGGKEQKKDGAVDADFEVVDDK
jgi:molecular chaperone DnaK